MNNIIDDMLSSACIISFNRYNQFILKSADNSFLETFGLTARSINSTINTILPKELNNFLLNLYVQHHNSHGSFTRFFKVHSPCSNSNKIHLTVTLYNDDDTVKFICRPIPIIEDVLGIFTNISCCGIREGKIIAISSCFYDFLEYYNLSPEDFSNCTAISASDKSRLPQSKIYIFSNNIQTHLYTTTAVPSDNSTYDYLLFLNKIPPESNLSAFLALTPRELEAVKLASKGYTNRIIADILGITEGCAARLLSNSYSKLQISSKLEIYNLF